jgi:hypothetical protein
MFRTFRNSYLLKKSAAEDSYADFLKNCSELIPDDQLINTLQDPTLLELALSDLINTIKKFPASEICSSDPNSEQFKIIQSRVRKILFLAIYNAKITEKQLDKYIQDISHPIFERFEEHLIFVLHALLLKSDKSILNNGRIFTRLLTRSLFSVFGQKQGELSNDFNYIANMWMSISIMRKTPLKLSPIYLDALQKYFRLTTDAVNKTNELLIQNLTAEEPQEMESQLALFTRATDEDNQEYQENDDDFTIFGKTPDEYFGDIKEQSHLEPVQVRFTM